MEKFNTLGVAHRAIREQVKPGDLCIDATAGRGHDTAFLAHLTGDSGHVIALDIQKEAIDSTNALLRAENLTSNTEVILDSHANIDRYALPGSVSCITFNFGYLPGGDHTIATHAESSIAAIEKGLVLLKDGGLMSLCIYYGGDSGFEERDALLKHLKTIDSKRYTVLYCDFYNRPNNPPIPVFIYKKI